MSLLAASKKILVRQAYRIHNLLEYQSMQSRFEKAEEAEAGNVGTAGAQAPENRGPGFSEGLAS